jgi:hypothetical protein
VFISASIVTESKLSREEEEEEERERERERKKVR